MAHPYNSARDHKVSHSRVASIAKACGGSIPAGASDVIEKRSAGGSAVKKAALRASGGAVKARSDRPARAFGGRTKKGGKKGKSGHTVNVIVGSHGAAPPAMPPRPPMAPPGVAAGPPPGGPPPMPPRPMAPPGPPGAMGGPPGVGLPPGIVPPMRKSGGKVTSANAGIGKGRTPIQRDFTSNKTDGKNIGRGSVITKKTGGPISSAAHGQMGPKFGGGARGGKAKLQKAHKLAASGYGKATVSAKNPTQNPHG